MHRTESSKEIFILTGQRAEFRGQWQSQGPFFIGVSPHNT